MEKAAEAEEKVEANGTFLRKASTMMHSKEVSKTKARIKAMPMLPKVHKHLTSPHRLML